MYRIDSRGPADIFNLGFTSWGGIHHYLGMLVVKI
ncbi:hypothetical protein [Serratia sp. P2ACOL2]